MSRRMRDIVGAVIVFGALLLPPSPAVATFAVYEDWHEGVIRSDRWLGGEDSGGQEIEREVTPANVLRLRYRHEGSTIADTGSAASGQFLNTAEPTQINEIEAAFTVSSLGMTTCAANNSGAATRARPARLLMGKFNDGTQSTPGNRLGDHIAGVHAFRDGSSSNPDGVLNVQGFIVRCTNASCSTNTPVITNTLATTVAVGQTFALRLKWDQPNHQFLFGLDDSSDIALPYAASDTAPANTTFVNIGLSHTTANCPAGAVVIDSTTLVGTVHVNLQISLGLTLNQHIVAPGDPVVVAISVANLGPSAFQDVFFVLLVPPELSTSLGCPAADAVVFLANAFASFAVRCVNTASPQDFPPLFSNVLIPGGFPQVTIPNFFSLIWPAGIPGGPFTVAIFMTPPLAFADGIVGPTDISAFAADSFTALP